MLFKVVQSNNKLLSGFKLSELRSNDLSVLLIHTCLLWTARAVSNVVSDFKVFSDEIFGAEECAYIRFTKIRLKALGDMGAELFHRCWDFA